MTEDAFLLRPTPDGRTAAIRTADPAFFLTAATEGEARLKARARLRFAHDNRGAAKAAFGFVPKPSQP